MTTRTVISENSSRDSIATVNPASATVEQLAKALGVSAEGIRRHVADGVPTDAGGRVNLVQYAAWLNYRLMQMDSEEAGHGD